MKGIKFIFLLFAVVFGGVGVGMFFGFVVPSIRDSDIAKSGKTATATITGYASNTTVNDEPYYYIKFTYINENGSQIQGKTNSAYTINEVYGREGEEFQIKYKNNRAVAYPYKKSGFSKFSWVFVLVFGGVGAGMGAAFIISVKRDIGEGKIKKCGTDGTGVYFNHTSNTTVNDSPIYRIHFTFTNQDGEYIDTKTRSAYRSHEAEIFAEMGEFPIKYIGKKAVIVFDTKEYLRQIQTMRLNNLPNQTNNENEKEGY